MLAVAENRVAREHRAGALHQKTEAAGRMPRRMHDADSAVNGQKVAVLHEPPRHRRALERDRRADHPQAALVRERAASVAHRHRIGAVGDYLRAGRAA